MLSPHHHTRWSTSWWPSSSNWLAKGYSCLSPTSHYFVSYERLSATYPTFALVVSFESLPHTYHKASPMMTHVVLKYLQTHFAICDLQTPWYFLGMDFAYQLGKLPLSQLKYNWDLPQERGLLACKPSTSPLEARPKFWDTKSPMMTNIKHYQHLLRNLIYLTITHPDITYPASVLS